MEKEIEIWKDIEGFEGLYQVSSWGKIKSLNYNKTGKEGILKLCKDKYGYSKVVLSKNNKRKNFSVHRLVCLAFLENPQNLPQINHIDENKENNHVNNLEFCSAHYNTNYGTRNERASEAKKGHISPNRKPIIQLDLQENFIRDWDSATTASKELNIYRQHIYDCCKGKRNKCGGFIWKYATT